MTKAFCVRPVSVRIEENIVEKGLSTSTALSETREAIVIRTLPNLDSKKHKNYSKTNPPYLLEEAATFIRESGIKHLLIDLPSVDRENDEGKLLAHKAFWNVKDVNNLNTDARLDCTITEMIFVEDNVEDGSYILNLQIASFQKVLNKRNIKFAFICGNGNHI